MFSVVGEAIIRYEPDVAGAHNLPLALAYKSFHYARLALKTAKLTSTGGYKTDDHREQIGHLKVLLTGRERLDVSPYPHIALALLIRRPSIDSRTARGTGSSLYVISTLITSTVILRLQQLEADVNDL